MNVETQAKIYIIKLVALSTAVSLGLGLLLHFVPLQIIGIAACAFMLIMLIRTAYQIKVDQLRSLEDLNSK